MGFLSQSDWQRVKLLSMMDGITNEEQQALWDLISKSGPGAKPLADQYVAKGATYRYTVAQVNQILGKRKNIFQQLFGL